MSTTPTAQSSVLSWGLGLAATSLILIGGGAIVYQTTSPPVVEPTTSDYSNDPPQVVQRRLTPFDVPMPPDESTSGLHTVSYTMENGVRVVKIRVLADSDELIVDAATGRLLETRPIRPISPPPAGKLPAPFVPM